MNTFQTIRLVCLSEALSPITHMDRTEGNEGIIAREPVVTTEGRTVLVPYLSGNAIRNRFVRNPGMLDLVERLELRGKLSLQQWNFLLHGGSITESTARVNPQRIVDWHRFFPLGKLLGGCLPDQILVGSLIAGRGLLVCEENRQTIASLYPDVASLLPDRIRTAESFVSNWKYVRGDASGSGLVEEMPKGKTGTENMMMIAGQAVTRGALFLHDFTIKGASRVEAGALIHAISLWQEAGGTIGGSSARGHGRLRLVVVTDPGVDPREARIAYLDHLAANQVEAVTWLTEVFHRDSETPGKKTPRSKKEPVAAKEEA